MSSLLILFVGVIYLYVAGEQAWKGNPFLGLVFFGYALSNVGLYIISRVD